jgi:hypothetical protein
MLLQHFLATEKLGAMLISPTTLPPALGRPPVLSNKKSNCALPLKSLYFTGTGEP